MRESLYQYRPSIDTRVISPRYEDTWKVFLIDLNVIKKNYPQLPVPCLYK